MDVCPIRKCPCPRGGTTLAADSPEKLIGGKFAALCQFVMISAKGDQVVIVEPPVKVLGERYDMMHTVSRYKVSILTAETKTADHAKSFISFEYFLTLSLPEFAASELLDIFISAAFRLRFHRAVIVVVMYASAVCAGTFHYSSVSVIFMVNGVFA